MEPDLQPRYEPGTLSEGASRLSSFSKFLNAKKNLLSRLDIRDFNMMNPAARNWLDTVANIRVHGETGKKPLEMFEKERNLLIPLSPHPYDIATVTPVRASKQFLSHPGHQSVLGSRRIRRIETHPQNVS